MEPKDPKISIENVVYVNTEDKLISTFGNPNTIRNHQVADDYFRNLIEVFRRPPTTMVPTVDGIREVENDELVRMFLEADELERLCREIPMVKDLYDQLQVAIKLYRE